MKIKRIFQTFIFSHIFIGLGAAVLSLSSYFILSDFRLTNASFELAGFIFFATVLVYNFYIVSDSYPSPGSSEREIWIAGHGGFIRTVFWVSFIGLLCTFLFLTTYQIIVLAHLAVLSFLYVHPFDNNIFKFHLRRFPVIKIFVLAYVWSSVTVVLPALAVGKLFNSETMLIFIERFVFILALAIPFDIRDYVKDKEENIMTIPGVFGVSGSKIFSISLLAGIVLFSFWNRGLDYVVISRAISAMAGIFLIYKINEKADDFFYMVFIDGVLIFHFVMLGLSYMLFGAIA